MLLKHAELVYFFQDQEKLKKFVLWLVSVAIQSKVSNEQPSDSLISKLLRWLIASVLLAKSSQEPGEVGLNHNLENSSPETLQSFLEAEWSVNRMASGSEELLATTIYYLHQTLGMKCQVSTSVVSALCLLLFPDSSHTGMLIL